MNPDMITRLRDIQGLDEISWWPLATGWWLLALLVIVLLFALVSLLRNLRRYPAGSWRRHAWKQLRTLKREADRMSSQEIAGELSELLRRIAIARLGRNRAGWPGCRNRIRRVSPGHSAAGRCSPCPMPRRAARRSVPGNCFP